MLKIGTTTKLSPEEAIKRAVAFFGPDEGYGLEITEQSPVHVHFEGGGGRVEVTACTGDKHTTVDIGSVEWDIQVRKFIDKLH